MAFSVELNCFGHAEFTCQMIITQREADKSTELSQLLRYSSCTNITAHAVTLELKSHQTPFDTWVPHQRVVGRKDTLNTVASFVIQI